MFQLGHFHPFVKITIEIIYESKWMLFKGGKKRGVDVSITGRPRALFDFGNIIKRLSLNRSKADRYGKAEKKRQKKLLIGRWLEAPTATQLRSEEG